MDINGIDDGELQNILDNVEEVEIKISSFLQSQGDTQLELECKPSNFLDHIIIIPDGDKPDESIPDEGEPDKPEMSAEDKKSSNIMKL